MDRVSDGLQPKVPCGYKEFGLYLEDAQDKDEAWKLFMLVPMLSLIIQSVCYAM